MSDRGGRSGWGDYREGATKFGPKFKLWAHPSEYANALMEEHRRIGVPWKDLYSFILKARTGDTSARDVVYASTYPLVLTCITKIKDQHMFQNVCYSEIVAVCLEGVEQAMQVFDPKLGSWSSLTHKCILNELREAWAKWKGMGLPCNIPHDGGMTTKKRYNAAAFRQIMSLERESCGGGYHHQRSLKESIPAKEESEAPKRLDPSLLAEMTKVEVEVLRLRYGLGGKEPLGLGETAAKLGKNRLTIRKIEARALLRLQALQKKGRGT